MPQGAGRDGGGRRDGGGNPGRGTPRGRKPRETRVRRLVRVVRPGSPWEEASSVVPASVGGTVRERCDGPLEESESVRGAPVRLRPAREVPVRESPAGVETPCGPEGTDTPPSGSGSVSPGRRATPEEGRKDAATRLFGSHCSSSLRRAVADCRRLRRQVSDVWMRQTAVSPMDGGLGSALRRRPGRTRRGSDRLEPHAADEP